MSALGPVVVPVVLAAGASRRMGRTKALLPFGGTTALGLVLAACREAALAPAVVVTGCDGEAVAAAARSVPGTRVVANPRWPDGRTTSLQAGLRALGDGPAGAAPVAALLWPVDMCLVPSSVVRALLAAAQADPARLGWVPSHGGRRGHPLLLAPGARPRFLALAPDEPARVAVRALAAEGALGHVEVQDPLVLRDMDTPEDYADLVAEHARRTAPRP